MTLILLSRFFYAVAGLVLVCLLGACVPYTSETLEERDSGPERPVDVSHIPEPVPRVEPRTIAGNKSPYTVLGRTYEVMPVPEGYTERGVASWYGRKFHGRRTSNGEVYDMYGMTAAHKTLPIPSYVRVTNTANNKSIIVRVNDRGPFHGDRVIDLTYTAAKKLGFEKAGTAPVLVEYIDPSRHVPLAPLVASASGAGASAEPAAPAPANAAGYALPANVYLQVGAFSQARSAMLLREQVAQFTELAVVVLPPDSEPGLYRVHVGPLRDNLQMQLLRQRLIEANFPAPHVVYP